MPLRGTERLFELYRAEEERAFMRALVAGLADLEAGRELSLVEAKVLLYRSLLKSHVADGLRRPQVDLLGDRLRKNILC